MKEKLSRLSGIWLAFLIFILPQAYGTSIHSNGIQTFSLEISSWILNPEVNQWLIQPWPIMLLPVFTAVALLLALFSARQLTIQAMKPVFSVLLPLIFLTLFSLSSLFYSAELDFALSFLWHMFSIVCFLLALTIHLANRPESRKAFLVSLFASVLIMSGHVLRQVHGGNEAVVKNLEYNIEHTEGFHVNPQILNRLKQNRAIANFIIPNSLGAFYILVIPLMLVLTWQWLGHVDPPGAARAIFMPLLGGLLLYCLYATKSRGAIACFILALLAFAIMYLVEKPSRIKAHLKWLVPGVVLLFVLAFPVYNQIQDGRSLSSLQARFDYWQASLEMIKDHPLKGIGSGNFLAYYMQYLFPGNEETRMPHSLFYFFATQAGVIAAAAAVYFLIFPVLFWKQNARGKIKLQDKGLFYAALLGCLAFSMHSLMDFNVQIPACMLIAVTLIPLTLKLDSEKTGDEKGDESALSAKHKVLQGGLFILALISAANLWRLPGELHYHRFVMQMNEKQPAHLWDDAVEISRKMPHYSYHWERLGKYAIFRGDLALAEQCFAKEAKLRPIQSSVYFHWARSLLGQGKYEEAEEKMRRAFELYPQKQRYVPVWRELMHLKNKDRQAAND